VSSQWRDRNWRAGHQSGTKHEQPSVSNFQNWLNENQAILKPPVNNKLLHDDSGMIVMIVGGPNTRVDFHDDPVEEWFYQIKGDMMLKIAKDGEIYDLPIREGEVFMMPPHTIHAPQRPQEGSIGIRGITAHGWHEGGIRMVLFQLQGACAPRRGRPDRCQGHGYGAAENL
jgi:mannose-6-phosphate isomerase-like protein (cupin superfamily)